MIVYFLIALIGIITASFYGGYSGESDAAIGLGVLSAFWPLVLLVVIVVGPFAGIYWLGKRLAR